MLKSILYPSDTGHVKVLDVYKITPCSVFIGYLKTAVYMGKTFLFNKKASKSGKVLKNLSELSLLGLMW